MDRFALLVDAGYFFAGGSEAAFGVVLPRKDLRLRDTGTAVQELHTQAGTLCGDVQLLRIYWYDAMPGPQLSLEQSELALQPGLKLRLGVLNSVGQQKGVDSLIVTDLIDLARNRAVTDAVVLSGDEDIRVGVQLAQSYGLRVHLWGAGDTAHNVSNALRMESDSFSAIDTSWFQASLEQVRGRIDLAQGRATAPQVAVDSIDGESLESAADRVSLTILSPLSRRDLQQLEAHFVLDQRVPVEYDRCLIAATAAALGGTRFSSDEMRTVRGVFVTVVRRLASTGTDASIPTSGLPTTDQVTLSPGVPVQEISAN
ncbi:NYN domain-containing protein [Brooklawnia propionicigenes]|uniref:NYN domain-containing protein n=1 Tax=Brooklawnia propionicigenes TaxID=3041175 RepID=A0AAN0KEN7_9ACTN|nr:NYN domain-containing protein [Brooklawnia sp. SH051]BEH02749.1 NYN domain-containing protein [Brooklawnia sp. SH051]